MKRIAVLTSGGDAPGMNAAIRAVVRTAISRGIEIMGYYRGYIGLIEGDCRLLRTEDVSNIIQRGGTMLLTARSEEFMHPEGRSKAYRRLQEHGVEGLVVIGGNGSFQGASLLSEEHNFPVIGIPGTIDNDLAGTDLTLGYSTALNTIIDAVDKIRDTASSHERIFFVEVMGRKSGFLALNAAIASGCEAALVPEKVGDYEQLEAMFRRGVRKSKTSSIVLVAEGDEEGGAFHLARRFRQSFPHIEVRYTVLGHLQRGGSPCAVDRILGGRMGMRAVDALLEGRTREMVGYDRGGLTLVPFETAVEAEATLDESLFELLSILSI